MLEFIHFDHKNNRDQLFVCLYFLHFLFYIYTFYCVAPMDSLSLFYFYLNYVEFIPKSISCCTQAASHVYRSVLLKPEPGLTAAGTETVTVDRSQPPPTPTRYV